MSSSAEARLAAAAREALAAAEQALADEKTAGVPDEVVQQLLTAGTRLFARKIEVEQRYFMPIADRDAVSATDAAVLMTEMMRAVDLNLFDLSMWASRPRDGEP
jgi:hypothetical protein